MENQNAVVVQHSMPPLTLQEVATQVTAVEQCIKQLMKENMHYGKIPGCGEKPTLLKPGAEMLCNLFQLAPEYYRTRHDLGNGHREIEVTCKLKSKVTGVYVGEGAGVCSTMESKYRWRKAQRSCPACGVVDAIGRSKFPPRENPNAEPGWYCKECKKQFDYNDPSIRNQKTGRAENPDIADQYNTVHKMADKRAYVAATITATHASDFVTQDIEDFVDNYAAQSAPVPTTATVVSSEPTKPNYSDKPPILAHAHPVEPAKAPAPTKPASEPTNPPKQAHAAQYVEGRVVGVVERNAKNGKPYWVVEMTDANGINCKASTWSYSDQQEAQQWQNAGTVCRMAYSCTNGYKNCEGFSEIPQQDHRQDDGAPLPEQPNPIDELPF